MDNIDSFKRFLNENTLKMREREREREREKERSIENAVTCGQTKDL